MKWLFLKVNIKATTARASLANSFSNTSETVIEYKMVTMPGNKKKTTDISSSSKTSKSSNAKASSGKKSTEDIKQEQSSSADIIEISQSIDKLSLKDLPATFHEIAFTKLNGVIVDDVVCNDSPAYNPVVVTFYKSFAGIICASLC